MLYAYARGNRSSRAIERACWEDAAFKVIANMRTPDRSTIAEFRRRHETEIAELFDDVLGLCREAGLVSVGVIVIDGTKIKADASMDQNRGYRELVTEILREAEDTDRREDELYGDQRGDELPEQLRTPEGRKAALGDAKRRIQERKGRAIEDGAPGLGYPKRWEDNEHWQGGWDLDRKGRLRLKAGGRIKKLLTIFHNPDLPTIDDYYEPWSYDYEKLITAPLSKHDPVARAKSQLTGRKMDKIEWGPNWDDNLAGAPERMHQDPLMDGLQAEVQAEYEQAFMFYLPRICEHCLNPSCVASCPSGAMYKREEDGIVLVDQAKCRGWRFCVSGCPYKKVYFNHRTGKAEKCTLCYPRIETGQPTICSETCVGRIRYIGLVLYDADRVEAAASTPDPQGLLEAQREVFVDPEDPAVREQAARDGIPEDWIDAARRSPVYLLAHRYRVALPLHPEYRTLPMVWYVPPLSPIRKSLEQDGYEADPDQVFPAIDAMRIPVEYLANLLSAGDAEVIRDVLRRLAAMRGHMRKREVLGEHDDAMAAAVGMSVADIEDMYRLLAIAKYEDRYVIPPAHTELADRMMEKVGACGLDFEGGPGNCGAITDPAAQLLNAAADQEPFMLTQEPVELDIVKMAGERRAGEDAAAS